MKLQAQIGYGWVYSIRQKWNSIAYSAEIRSPNSMCLSPLNIICNIQIVIMNGKLFWRRVEIMHLKVCIRRTQTHIKKLELNWYSLLPKQRTYFHSAFVVVYMHNLTRHCLCTYTLQVVCTYRSEDMERHAHEKYLLYSEASLNNWFKYLLGNTFLTEGNYTLCHLQLCIKSKTYPWNIVDR